MRPRVSHTPQAQKQIDAMDAQFSKALEMAKGAQKESEELQARIKASSASGSSGQADANASGAAPLNTPVANVMITHGNLLYDWSQVRT